MFNPLPAPVGRAIIINGQRRGEVGSVHPLPSGKGQAGVSPVNLLEGGPSTDDAFEASQIALCLQQVRESVLIVGAPDGGPRGLVLASQEADPGAARLQAHVQDVFNAMTAFIRHMRTSGCAYVGDFEQGFSGAEARRI